jgi:hypothetical protein
VSFELPLPAFQADEAPREGSQAAAYLRQLLLEAVPGLDVVAVARRPGVLAKVAVRSGSVPGDVLAQLRAEFGGERIETVRWSSEPRAFIAAALGLEDVPPIVLKPAIRHAIVLIGEIDVRGLSGWRGINRHLASAVTGWRIHLRPVAETPAWGMLKRAMAERRSLAAIVLGRTRQGLRVELEGLHARLPRADLIAHGAEVRVRVTRMDPDEGTILVTRRFAQTGQLPLPR